MSPELMRELVKQYPSPEDLLKEIEEIGRVGGFMLGAPEAPQARESVTVALGVDGQALGSLEAEVVFHQPEGEGYRVGVELRGNWQEQLADVRKKAEAPGSRAQRWGKDSGNLAKAVENMTMPEKIQMALKGGREERRVLLRNNHYMLHPYVLQNRKITTEEVAEVTRMPTITNEMILKIAGNTEWMQNDRIRVGIVRNPKTPVHIVQKHISKVRDQELIRMVKTESVREAISRLAQKVLASRGRHVR